jgi:hypothetical protein
MPRPTYRLSTVLLSLSAASRAVLGLPISTVNATANSTTCTQTGSINASCSVGSPVLGDAATALATATWGLPAGRLETIVSGTGFSGTASASVTFSGDLVVTGSSGTGNLTVQFSGFHDPNGPDLADTSVSAIAVDIGGTARSLTFPGGLPSTFSATAPVTFETLIPFSVSFSDSATGIMFHDGTRGTNSEDAVLFFPAFLVSNANGQPIGNVHVQLTPEPASLVLIACALPLLILGGARSLTASHRIL